MGGTGLFLTNGDRLMRVKKFDQQEQAALRALGFDIDGNGKVAKIVEITTICVIHPSDDVRFHFDIEMPNGMSLTAWLQRDMLLHWGGEEEDAA
jgi:hypothetical protein